MNSSHKIGKYIRDRDATHCGISVVTRGDWNARPPQSESELQTPVNLVFICHTVTPQYTTPPLCCALTRVVQKYHMDDKRWDDIGYNFLIGGDGRVYVGRGWTRLGAHNRGYNVQSIGVAFMGTFNAKAPSNKMISAAQNLIQSGVLQGYISPNYSLHGHSSLPEHGQALYDLIQTWPHWETRPLPQRTTCVTRQGNQRNRRRTCTVM